MDQFDSFLKEKSEEINSLKRFSRNSLSDTEAASIIQRAWRRFIDIQVFKYYKDLIQFHSTGDPHVFMRCINPVEAKLIDAGSGIRLRFRLAGEKFPPTIYYKIFTHLPIQDICANAPRDYTRVKWKTAEIVNNKIQNYPLENTEGWYQRIENNNWRPVSDKHLAKMNLEYYICLNQEVERQLAKPKFKHTKTLRKQDVEAKRKKLKVQWMKKMYKEGLLRAKGGDEETNMIIEEAAKNLIDTLEKDGLHTIEDWEVNELLEWTNTLNFDEYAKNWSSLGTSAFADKLTIERRKLKYSIQKDYDLMSIDDTDSLETSNNNDTARIQNDFSRQSL